MRDRQLAPLYGSGWSNRTTAANVFSGELCFAANRLTRLQRVSLFVPGPGRADDGRKVRMGGVEVQRRAGGGSIRDQIGRVTGAARLDDMGDFAPGLGRDRRENLPHRKTVAAAEIEGAAGMALQQQLQR